MIRQTRHPFTLFEVILALIIIAISIMGVLGMFPIGMRMHNNAMRRTQAADIADELLCWAAVKVRNNAQLQDRTTVINRVKNADLDLQSSQWTGGSTEDDSAYYYYGGSFNNGVVRVVRSHTAHRGDANTLVTDLDVVFAIYKDDEAPVLYLDNSDDLVFTKLSDAAAQHSDDRDVVRIVLEASWPASRKYSKRKKLVLVTEVLK